jgi:hypothetical protein
MVIIGIYIKSSSLFTLIVTYGYEAKNIQALTLFQEFYGQYMDLVQTYHTNKLATLTIKNIGNAIYGKHQLITTYSSIHDSSS